MAPRSPRVVLRADDMGMHPAIDDAILAACAAGTVGEVAWLPVGPTAAEAAGRLSGAAVEVSVHLAFASEWDRVRWSSLTGRLNGADGALPPHPSLLAGAPSADLLAEAVAQIDRARSLGLSPTGFNFHIDAPDAALAASIEQATGLACRDIPLGARPRPAWFDGVYDLSSRPSGRKRADLLAFLAAPPPGRQCIVAHPGIGRTALETLCSPALGPRRAWAVDHRLSDAEVLAGVGAADIRAALATANGADR